jgi:hypothetical protein
MKNLLPLFLAACISLTNSSCSKKEDPAPLPATPDYSKFILGEWYPITTVDVTTTSSGQSSTQTLTYANRDISEVFTATTVTAYYRNSSALPGHHYTVSGTTYTEDNGGGVSFKYEIVTLNSTTFVRKLTTIHATYTVVSTMTLVR